MDNAAAGRFAAAGLSLDSLLGSSVSVAGWLHRSGGHYTLYLEDPSQLQRRP